MADIFISYSRRDAEQALVLAERLRTYGANVWMDTAVLAAAETWSAEIVNAIEKCTHFFLLLSDDSVASLNVTKEVSLASEAKKIIVPIEIHHCELNAAMKYALAGLQKVSLSDEVSLVRAFEKFGIGSADVSSASFKLPETPGSEQDGRAAIRIAVLPFEDQSPAHDNEWFSDGLTDELISTLNKLDALFVLDRKSSKIYKDAKMTVKHIAHELNVRYVVTGAVRKAGDKLRIQASLIDAVSGATLWDDKFDGTMEDIFEIQEKTALDICEGLKLKLTPEEEQLLEEKLTSSPEAFTLFMQGRVKGNVEGKFEEAAALAERALAIDPNYLPALHLAAINYSNLYRTRGFKPEWLEREKATVARIMEIDPTSYYSYGPRANYYVNLGEKQLALEMAQKMVALQPKKWASYAVLGFVASNFSDTHTSLFAFEEALKIDPAEVRHVEFMLNCCEEIGDPQRLQRIWKQARPHFLTALEVHPLNEGLRINYMTSAETAGESEISLAQAEYFLSLPELTPEIHYNVSGILSRNGRIEEAIMHLRKALDEGWTDFSVLDEMWFISLKGTPEYDAIINHIGNLNHG